LTLNDAYPTGALLKDQSSGELYYVESGIKYPIIDEVIATNRYANLSPITVAATELEQYETGESIKLRDGALIRTENSAVVYVISDGQRRAIESEEIFNSFGYKWSNILVVSKEVLDLHPLGASLDVVLN
jgi:hypothetical protein